MFIIHVQIDFSLHFPVDVWPYVRFVLACDCNELIVKQRIRRLFFFVFGRTLFFFISVGKTVCILRYVKLQRAKKLIAYS